MPCCFGGTSVCSSVKSEGGLLCGACTSCAARPDKSQRGGRTVGARGGGRMASCSPVIYDANHAQHVRVSC